MSDPPYVGWTPGTTPVTVRQQQEMEDWQRNNRPRSYVPPQAEPMRYDAPVDQSEGPMTYVPSEQRTSNPTAAPTTSPVPSGANEIKLIVLAAAALIVFGVAFSYNEYLGFLVGAALIYGIIKFVLEQQAIKASISTGPEMDAVLVAKYNKDLAKYHRKLKALANEQMVARSAKVNNAAFNIQPKPPRKPTLSTDRPR